MGDAAPLPPANAGPAPPAVSGFAESGGLVPDQYDEPAKVTSQADYDKLPHNAQYADPDGNVRTKQAYQVTNEKEYHAVPEGGTYVDPDGNERQKPQYEPLSYSAQTMHSMAVTPQEKRKVLEKFYPGMVEGDDDNLVVNDNGTYRAPGKMTSLGGAAGVIGGNIAPVAGGVLGGLATSEGGPVAAGGAALGTMAGQYFNDIILKLNGLYDRTPGEEAADKAIGAGASLAGDIAGRGIAAFVPSVKAGVSNVSNAAPKVANKFLGTAPEDVTRFREIGEMGEKPSSSATLRALGMTDTTTAPGISTIAKESPHLQNVQEVFHEAFDTSQPRKTAAEAAYNKMGEPLMEAQGVGVPALHTGADTNHELAQALRTEQEASRSINARLNETLDRVGGDKNHPDVQKLIDEGVAQDAKEKIAQKALEEADRAPARDVDSFVKPPSLVDPTPVTSVQSTGEKIIRKALEDSGQIDARFAEELANRKAAAAAGVAEAPAQREAILGAARAQQQNATQLIHAGLTDVERNADQAVQAAAQGTNSGDLWHSVGEQLRAVRQGIGTRFRNTAQAAYETGPPGARIDTAPISSAAEDFIANVPEEMRARNPGLIRSIEALGARTDEEGQAIPGMVSLEQLHNMRSALRSQADWYDLPSDFKNGSLKYFSHQIDDLMQSLGTNGSPYQTAIRMLNDNDRWYAQEIPVFNARELKTVLRGLEAGEPADPGTLYKALIQPGNKELIARTEQVVGPNLWNGVRGAQRQQWLQSARADQFDRSVDAVKYAKEVLAADADGTLNAVQGRQQGQALLQQAQQIAMLNGKLDVGFRPNDTAFDVFRQARLAMDAAEKEANVDPLKTLARETRKIEGEMRQQAAQTRRADPLNFLTNKSVGATKAVNKILGDEDLVLAAAARFGEKSPEFDALRQVWTERIFRGTLEPGKRLEKVSPEVQHLMLGVNLQTAQKLAEDMSFIMGSKAMERGNFAGGMSAMSKVEHPLGGKTLSRAARIIPGANTAARATLGAYYSLMNKVLESPATARWLEKAYTGGEQHRAMVRSELARIMNRGGAIGAGAAQGANQLGND